MEYKIRIPLYWIYDRAGDFKGMPVTTRAALSLLATAKAFDRKAQSLGYTRSRESMRAVALEFVEPGVLAEFASKAAGFAGSVETAKGCWIWPEGRAECLEALAAAAVKADRVGIVWLTEKERDEISGWLDAAGTRMKLARRFFGTKFYVADNEKPRAGS